MAKRLEKLAELVRGQSSIDIGSDHGYLLLKLKEKGFKQLMAIEKNKGPLVNCINNIKRENLETEIKVVLSDGLKNISKEEASSYESIIIAGMGGNLIASIIENDIKKFETSYLILQPNNNEYNLRKFLNINNFDIEEEIIVEENSKCYEIIVAKHTNEELTSLTEEQLMFGIKQDYSAAEFQKKWKNESKYLNNLKEELRLKNIELNESILSRLKLIEKRESDT